MEKDDFKHECCSHWHPAPLFSSWPWWNMAYPTGVLSVGVLQGSSPTAVGRRFLDYSCWCRCLASACAWCSYSPGRIRSTPVINTTKPRGSRKEEGSCTSSFSHTWQENAWSKDHTWCPPSSMSLVTSGSSLTSLISAVAGLSTNCLSPWHPCTFHYAFQYSLFSPTSQFNLVPNKACSLNMDPTFIQVPRQLEGSCTFPGAHAELPAHHFVLLVNTCGEMRFLSPPTVSS